ncbi:MAG: hypothetical protein ACOCWI_03120 [Bacillota bacterium]
MRISKLFETLAYKSLKKDIDNDSLSHAYMVVSQDKLARRQFLKLAAAAIMCGRGGCLECNTCKRVLERSHLDVKFIDIKEKMTVEEAISIIEDTYTASLEGGRKLYLIDNAENMSLQVQNKFLKTYEEPNEKVTIFMAISNENSMLKTIYSRAKKLFINPFMSQDIVNELMIMGVEKSLAETAAAYSQGSMENAEKMVENEEYQQLFTSVMEILLAIKNSKQIVDFFNNRIFDKEYIATTLDFMQIILSDVLILCTGADVGLKIINREYDLQNIKEGFSAAGAAMAIIAINDARKRIFYNINLTSVTERLLFDILEAKYKWQ